MVLAFQLLDGEEQQVLKQKLNEVEEMVLEKEFIKNKYLCRACGFRFKTIYDWFELQGCPKCESSSVKTIRDRQSLYDIEMAMESNRDFTAFFQRYGQKVTKFDVERRLMLIKAFIFRRVRDMSEKRRFKRFR